jgi:glycosyltransferase involved in cell wall biosynthesis/GT2 family glycosyltransferase
MSQGNTETKLKQQVQEWLRTFPPDAPVVAVPVYNAFDDVLECIESLAASTPAGTPVLILDDASNDPRIAENVGPLARSKGFVYARKPANSGFVGTVNLAFAWCAPRDVVVLNSDIVVPPGWLERLQAAVYYRDTIATATPLTNHGTMLSVPYRNKPIPDLVGGATAAEVDARIQQASLCLRPILPTAIGHCIYFKRAALDTIGYFDEVFAPGYGEEVDFSQRAVMSGFCHVAADDLFVYHKGSASFDPEKQSRQRQLQSEHEKIITARYPWYHAWVERATTDAHSPLALALESARSALLGYRIAIDATRVDGFTTGTQVLILELIRALATRPERNAHLALIVRDRMPIEALLGLDQLVDEIVRLSDLENAEQPRFDLVHRPSQIRSAKDLVFFQKAGYRFIISQLDCIAFSNPSYQETAEGWYHYRHLTQLTFAAADGIIFISNDAAQDAAHQGLRIPPERTSVSYVGVDHQQHAAAPKPPPAGDTFQDQPFLLMLGTNFRHKNRVYGLRLLKALATRYQWPGHLVFAGPKVSSGGSVDEESRELEHNPELQPRVHDVGPVNEEQKKWLLENAALVLYPSLYEGFGLIPFEAAAAGTPALTTPATSLAEVLGEKVTYLDTLDPSDGVEVAWRLLSDPSAARKQVAAIEARASEFTWQKVADRTWAFYEQILRMPPRSRDLATEQALDQERLLGTEPAKGWWERLKKAVRILRSGGPGALVEEIRQFVDWLRR